MLTANKNQTEKKSKTNSLVNKKTQGSLSNILIVITTLLQLGIFAQQAITLIWIGRLARKPPPTLVQLLDGEPVEVSAVGSKVRTAETIQRFTSDIMTWLFSARGVINSENSSEKRLDEGVELSGLPIEGRNKKIPTPAFEASFALSEDFRGEFLANLAEMTPSAVFRGKTQTMLVIRHLSTPNILLDHRGEEVEGEYVVEMIADLLIFTTTNKVGQTIPVNKEIYLRSVYQHSQPLPDTATQLEREIYRIRRAGLEIYQITDLD